MQSRLPLGPGKFHVVVLVGKFKDEAAGIPITEFVGLRSKMYSYTKDNDKNEKTTKGIKKIYY